MTLTGPSVVQAAGAVCWRETPSGIELLIVHRGDRADVSIPKGKVDPGETPPQTAVREIAEETGLVVTLGAPLGTTEYTMPGGREKIVHYWSAEVSDAAIAGLTFVANAEVTAVQWLSVTAARAVLSYDLDRDVVDRFSARAAAGTIRTFPIIVLRHGRAVPPASWDGPDATRPLMHRGLEQSRNVAAAIAAWGPAKLISSPAARCLATIEPVATLTDLPVKQSAGISQDAFEDGVARVHKMVRKRLAAGIAVVLCSHGPVIRDIIDEAAALTNTPLDAPLRRAGMLSTSEFTVLHVSSEHPDAPLVAVETHGPAFL
ncbi:NUDIX hydrolase [Frigoribacterium sp. CG_9.8]|uniref:NUDIX hydrolase n=1 Tax=Frigoribacterium sp. CG_9.8 TaxID=2787733 RepID=UPI0018CB26F3|nr:NUDIX hydrolase [Frigoribacterium sp. CG_9.8]MBG6108475.1 8-oxo-dGTP diphosphatase [Frigoribacterium sp. CG_9.8]